MARPARDRPCPGPGRRDAVICLTFDTDHMNSEGLVRFLETMPLPGRGTFFQWKAHEQVDWGEHEIEPHPSFAPGAPWSDQLDAFIAGLAFVPRGLRPHSCAYSQIFCVALAARGYRYVSAATPLFQMGLHPYRHPWGVWEVPIFYMDNMDFCMPRNWPALGHRPFARGLIDRAIDGPDLFVFDFHPLHVALNASTQDEYARVKRRVVEGGVSPFDLAFGGYGTRSFYLDLCRAMEDGGLSSVTCLDAVEAAERETATP